jgi:cytochrome b561
LRDLTRARPLAYTRIQIALHWLVAALVLAQYATSGAIVRTHSMHSLGWRPNPTDLVLHTLHNRVGLAIIALMVGRLALRLWIGVPPPGDAARGLATRLAQGVHFAFYVVLISEGVTGAIATYIWWPMSTAHVVLFDVLLALVTLHVAAALWHEFVRKDAVMHRIGFSSFFGIGAQERRHASDACAFRDADQESGHG